jgi:NitT/TauT family transport system substrate-binding protein
MALVGYAMKHNSRLARRSSLKLVLSAWVIVALTGCAGASPGPAAAPPAASPAARVTPVSATVRAGSIFALTDSPLFMALERGYFQEVGITLELQQFDTIANMIPLVSTGQLDVAFDGASSAGFFNAIARGIEIKMVANQGIARNLDEERPYYAIVASKPLVEAGRIRRVADLRGLPVNVLAEGVLAQLLVATALQAEGLTLADVQQQTLSFPDTLAGLQNGSLAASFLVEPFITLGRQQGVLEVLVSAEKLAPDREITVVLYSAGFAQKEPVASNFLVAYLKGVRDYVQTFFGPGGDRTAAVSQLVKHLPVKDPALYARMGMPYVNPDGRINTADIKAQQDWYVAQGQVQQPIDVDRVVDNRFAEFALRVLGPYRP